MWYVPGVINDSTLPYLLSVLHGRSNSMPRQQVDNNNEHHDHNHNHNHSLHGPERQYAVDEIKRLRMGNLTRAGQGRGRSDVIDTVATVHKCPQVIGTVL